MNSDEFYRFTGPSKWAGPPVAYSHSSLLELGHCALKWQLTRSAYPGFERYPERPSEFAEAGKIVHVILGRLYWAMGRAGSPDVDTPAYEEAMDWVDVLGSARVQLGELSAQIALHPRGHGFRLRTTAREIYNSVSQLFRRDYKPVRTARVAKSLPKGIQAQKAPKELSIDEVKQKLQLGLALSEVTLRHPTLPLMGIVDLLERRDGRTSIVDFKSGEASPEHHRQVLLYSLLWWRQSTELPGDAELRYRGEVEHITVNAKVLEEFEKTLQRQLAEFTKVLNGRAPASVGTHCHYCPVRQFCDSYWDSKPPLDVDWADVEVVFLGAVAADGFLGRTRDGRELTFSVASDAWIPSGLSEGLRLRVLGAGREKDSEARRLGRLTEVFAGALELGSS